MQCSCGQPGPSLHPAPTVPSNISECLGRPLWTKGSVGPTSPSHSCLLIHEKVYHYLHSLPHEKTGLILIFFKFSLSTNVPDITLTAWGTMVDRDRPSPCPRAWNTDVTQANTSGTRVTEKCRLLGNHIGRANIDWRTGELSQ